VVPEGFTRLPQIEIVLVLAMFDLGLNSQQT
jgi:hypothetical protein